MGNHSGKSLLLADPAVKYFWCSRRIRLLEVGVLNYKCMVRNRWYLPEILNLKGTVLKFCHCKGMAGHMGIKKT